MPEPIDILLVDDEPRNLDALEAILTDPGYRLIRAGGGDEALRLLLENDVAAIVLDIRMPGVSGFELAQMIKGTKRFRQIPILFLTAHMMEDQDIVAGYGAGAVDYLTKPLNPVVLRHKLAVFAELFRKTRALAELNATLEERVKERTAMLEQSEAALRVAAKQKDEFLATLAHELRNPLAPLRMGLDLLLRKSPPEDSKRTLSVMNRQLDHMVRLIDDLLDVARISGGQLSLKKERINVAAAIQTALDTCRPFLEQRSQKVAAELDESLVSWADPTRLAQIVGNVLHNASKFSPQGGQIHVTLASAGTGARVTVMDSGIGIPAEQLPRVFEMFTRVEGAGSSGQSGLGIGLALSRRLAEMHNGTLTVHSAGPGQGSTFTLTIPAEVGSPQPGDRTNESVRAPASPRRLRVLIVEDNRDAAEVLALSLDIRGYHATIAHTGAEGLELLLSTRPQVVLCDIGLPDMDGTEVCRRARALDLDYRLVMVALTGWGMKADLERTRASGFDRHLVKPVAPETLFKLLDGLDQGVPLA
ncbi:MAG: hybrid sensor histidine kinase/response regulator [Myxococcales bacterium]|nr:MAG: hybrid sensor histidine kinase/response regulator [Myxococcales bacterium]